VIGGASFVSSLIEHKQKLAQSKVKAKAWKEPYGHTSQS
jgi:hypothetical protein